MRWREKFLIEGRERGCGTKMDNNEEKEDAGRRWITMKRKRMRKEDG
jgi:hypothetical protein